MLSGFVAEKVIHPEELDQPAVKIDVPEGDQAAAPKKPQKAEPILAMLGQADVEAGKNISRACAACHSFDKGGPNRVGPNLYNVVMADIARNDQYAYSDALMEKDGVWDYDALNQFLWRPKKWAPGTKMNFIGLDDPEDRADIIAWLRTLSDDPADLPTSDEINASLAEEPAMEGAIEDTMQDEEVGQDEEGAPEDELNNAMEEVSSKEETLMDKTDADDPPHIP